MSEILLLGAGASLKAGVPDALGMTRRILSDLRAQSTCAKQAHALSFVVGALLFEAGKNNENPLEPTIHFEELFNTIQQLSERETLEAMPFIGSWHPFIEELEKQHPDPVVVPSADGLQRQVFAAVTKEIIEAFSQNPPPFGAERIEKSLTSMVSKTVEASVKKQPLHLTTGDSVGHAMEGYIKAVTERWLQKLKCPAPRPSGVFSRPHPATPENVFAATGELMIRALKKLAWIDNVDSIQYFSPLLNLLEQQKRLVIATLNYDNSIELLASSAGVPCNTGLSDWQNQRGMDISAPGIHLLKLHGSIDWLRAEGAPEDGRMPFTTVRRLPPEDFLQSSQRPAIAFGSRDKLLTEGPFLDLIRCFQDELERCNTLTVVGYSFRDVRVNLHLSRWLNADSGHKLQIINGPAFRDKSAPAGNRYIDSLLHFEETHPGQVKILEEYVAGGLTQLYGKRP